jgi:hypothetical protein
MDDAVVKVLPATALRLLEEVEAIAGHVRIERDPDCVSDGQAFPRAEWDSSGYRISARITYRDALTPALAVHELLHLHRNIVEEIPTVTLRPGPGLQISTEAAKNPGAVDEALEHLVINSRLLREFDLQVCMDEDIARKRRTLRANARKRSPTPALLDWLMADFVAPELKPDVAVWLENIGQYDQARVLLARVRQSIHCKEAVCAALFETLGIPRNYSMLRYITRGPLSRHDAFLPGRIEMDEAARLSRCYWSAPGGPITLTRYWGPPVRVEWTSSGR